MQHNHLDWQLLLLYALAAVVGGAGGCAMAAALSAKGVKITRWVVLAYASVGAFTSMILTAFLVLLGRIVPTIENILVYGGGSAIIVVGVLAGVNVTIHLSSKRFVRDVKDRFGVEVDMEK